MGRRALAAVVKGPEWCVALASFEWLLTRCQLPNGGSIILLRGLAVAVVVDLVGIGAVNLLDPTKSMQVSWSEFRSQLVTHVHWFGATLAVAYAALYARFASQWAYLAGLYNQIKAAECRSDCDVQHLADWKAGFIIDARELHLANKPLFRSVISEWRRNGLVEAAFQSARGLSSDPPPDE